MGILFLVFAAVQMNDPDPFGWMAIYIAAAIIAILGFFERYYIPFIGATLLAALLWLLGLIPEIWQWIQAGMPNIAKEMKAESPHIEYTREFLGLLLIVLVVYWQFRQGRKKLKSQNV